MGAVLPPFKPKLQEYAKRTLERMGVEIRLNTLAVDMDHDSITLKGPDGLETIRTRTRIWGAGVQASPLAKLLAEKTGAESDRPGRVAVNPDCSLPGHPEVFAIGDMALLNKLPGVAQPAMQEGKYVGKLIKARIDGAPDLKPFKYFDKGSMATIGHKAAVADAFGRQYTGFLAYLMWLFIHVLYLIGWGNRIGTLYMWLRSLAFARNRGNRVITYEQAHYEVAETRTRTGRPVPILPRPEQPVDASTSVPVREPAPQVEPSG
jgi:NADH dehydrogenase